MEPRCAIIPQVSNSGESRKKQKQKELENLKEDFLQHQKTFPKRKCDLPKKEGGGS